MKRIKKPRTPEQKAREREWMRERRARMTPEERARDAAYSRQWRKNNPEKYAAGRQRHKQKWLVERRDEFRELQRSHRYSVRREILDLLGGQRCVHCGFDSDWRALCIDHINSDGRTDEKVEGKNNQWAFRNALRDPEFLVKAWKKYQVLCCNCNRIKQHEQKEFPGLIKAVPPEMNRRRAANSKRIN